MVVGTCIYLPPFKLNENLKCHIIQTVSCPISTEWELVVDMPVDTVARCYNALLTLNEIERCLLNY